MELLLTCLLILFLPSQLGLHFWPAFAQVNQVSVDYLSPTLLFTDLLVIPLLGFYLHRQSLKLPKNLFLVILLILLNIIFSLNPLNSFFKYLRLLEYFLLLLSFISRPKYLYSSLIHIFPFSIILINILGWLQFFTQHSQNGLWYFWGERTFNLSTPFIAKISLGNLGQFLRPYSTFSHPNSFAGFLLISALILFYLYRRHPNPQTLISLILTLVTIPLTFSRSIILLESLSLFILLSNKLIKIPALLVSLFLLIFSGNTQSLSERISLVQLGFVQIKLHPIFGIGLGNFPIISPAFQPIHVIPLLLLVELGILLLILLLILLTPYLKNLFRLPLPLILSWFCVLITSLIDHYWISFPQNLLLLTILAALSLPFLKTSD